MVIIAILFIKMDNLTGKLLVKFENDDRCFTLDDFTYEKYDKSVFVLHKRFTKTNELLLKDITYDDFIPIYEFLTTNNRNVILKNTELFDYFGIYDAELNLLMKVNEIWKKKRKDILTKINNFLDGKDKILVLKSYDTYKTYKEILENNNNILPIQLIMNQGICSIFCVYGIPIYNKFTKWLDTDLLEVTDNNYNISGIREIIVRLFLKGIKKSSKYNRRFMMHYNYFLKKYIKIMQTIDEVEFISEFMELYRDVVEKSYNELNGDEEYEYHGIRVEYNPNYDKYFVINETKLDNIINQLKNESEDINYLLNIPNKSNNLIAYHGFVNIK